MKKSNSILKTAAVAFGALHCVNKFIESNSSISLTSKSSDHFYHWKHGDIFYKVTGQGEPLLLIHDLTVFSSGYEWAQLANSLSLDYTVYTIDLIGCGRSDKPSITYTNYFYVQMISDFVKNVIQTDTKVAATGLSSSFVLMANALDSDLFSEIMLISPPSISSLKAKPTERSKFLLKFIELPILGKTAYYLATNQTNTNYFLTKKMFHNYLNVKPGICKAYYDAAHTGKGNGRYLMASLDGNYLQADITNALHNTDKRIVIATGLHNENRKDILAAYQKINPHLAFEIISDSKYLPQLENIDELAEIMYHF